MPRQAKLRRHKGQWCTNAGNRQGVYFGRVADIPYSEAKRLFCDYLSSLGQTTRQHQLPACSVAEVCDAHLSWIKRNRSEALYSQRKCLLNHWCNHRVGELAGRRLAGHGQQIGRLRAHIINRQHAEEYLDHRRTTPCKRTGEPLGDKSQRAIVIALKACWNWAAGSLEDNGGGLLPPNHQPLKKLSRGYVELTDLTEADLPTDQEIEILLRWATVDLSRVRAGKGRWRRRQPDEFFGNPDWRVFRDMLRVYHETGRGRVNCAMRESATSCREPVSFVLANINGRARNKSRRFATFRSQRPSARSLNATPGVDSRPIDCSCERMEGHGTSGKSTGDWRQLGRPPLNLINSYALTSRRMRSATCKLASY